MKTHAVVVLTVVTLVALCAAGCGPAAATPTPAPAPAPAAQAPAAAAVLSISGAVEKPMSWSLADLKSMGMAKLDLNHPKKGAGTYEGIRLTALLSAAKPTASAKMLTMSASDGFKSDIALADVLKCADCLLAIDSTGALSTAMPNMEGAMWVRNLVKLEVK
jgi:DMSO/TMAO reductase YedYZ molybdopterin-dependent catalytic subunit